MRRRRRSSRCAHWLLRAREDLTQCENVVYFPQNKLACSSAMLAAESVEDHLGRGGGDFLGQCATRVMHEQR
jgi:hypothetical protein